jgi:hypothetical protein
MKRITALVCAFSLSFCASAAMAYAAQEGNSANRGNGRRFEQVRRAPNQGGDRDKDHNMKEIRQNRGEESVNRFEERLARNPELRAKVERLLPAGMNVTQAASGFRNQGQFIAALHVSKNLGIPFDQLKARMAGPEPMPLGRAIQELKPTMTDKEANREATRAEEQAHMTGSR